MKVRPQVLVACAVVSALSAPVSRAQRAADAQGVSEADLQAAHLRGLANGQRRKVWEGKLTLPEAVNLALKQNLDLMRAFREVERAQGKVIEVKARALPHLSLDQSFNTQDKRLVPPNQQRFIGNVNSWAIDLTLRQNIYSGGAITAAVSSAKFTRNASYYALRDTLDKVVGQVRQQFSQVLVTEALVDVAQESVELATQQLKDAQNRFNAGTVPRFTVLRAEVELASVKPQLIRSKNDHLIAQLQLAKTLALDPGSQGKPTFRCSGHLDIGERPLDLQDAMTLGLARRPSLKGLREQMLADKESVKEAQAGFKPTVNVTGGVRLRNNNNTAHLDQSLDGYFLGLVGSWKLFDSFETVGLVAQSKAKLRSDTLAYEDAVRQVELEVQKSFADLRQFRETIESQQKNVQQALEALRLAQERLSAGAGTQLEVLDARVALTRARTTELQARGDYVRSLAEFDRATATQTVYSEEFKDPLQKLEHQVLHRDYSHLFKP
jgi:outer membrane protein TolC